MGTHWWAVNFYESVSRVGVPLFFMVTGALLLSKETSAKASIKRIWRVVLPLVFWSVIYLSWFEYTGTSFNNWIATIIKGPIVAHFWYLYTLIGVYIFLPVMIGFCKVENTSSQLLALAGCFIGSSIVPMLYALQHTTYIGIEWNFLPLYAGYLIAGWFLYTTFNRSSIPLWIVAAVWFMCASATAIFTWQHSLSIGHADETFYVYSSPFVIVGALTSFVLIRALFTLFLLKSSAVCRFLIFAGKLNFGIYLVHVLVMFWVDLNGLSYNVINPWVGIPVTSLVIFILSGLLVYIVQRIPFLKQVVPA